MSTKITITLESEQAYEWLKVLIANTIAKPTSTPMLNSYEEVIAWHEALQKAEIENTSPPPKRHPRKKTAAKKKTSTRRKKDTSGLVCPDHPHIQGMRAPRTDCQGCWDLYAKLNGEDQRRIKYRQFKLKQKQKESNS